MIIHLSDPSLVSSVSDDIPAHARDLISAFFPGPLTVVLFKSKAVPHEVTGGLETVGIRVPSHSLARQFLTSCGRPVAAPSANRSGRPSPTTWESVVEDLGDLIPCILKGDRSPVGLESTVVDCTGEFPIVLRIGAVSLQALRHVNPSVQPLSASGHWAKRSPGLRYRHYAPLARVRFLESTASRDPCRKAYIGITRPPELDRFDRVLLCRDVDHYAYELFHYFRACDRNGIEVIYCERPLPSGIGSALIDRITRAAEASSRADSEG